MPLLELMSGYFAVTGKIVADSGGRLIKTLGDAGLEIIDVYGKTVNVAANLPSTGLAMSPAVFRSLEPATRQLFRKHTPPVTYISVDDSRPD